MLLSVQANVPFDHDESGVVSDGVYEPAAKFANVPADWNTPAWVVENPGKFTGPSTQT